MKRKEFLKKFLKEEIIEFPHQTSVNPSVSVCVQTYRHENYIKQCLDGILEQKTNFEFEILLGEDDSPDNTRQICIEYANNHPEKIRLFLHNRANIIKISGTSTGRFNFLYNLFSARGKYIALCEGDDYWTDPYKLQKQVDFLEVNPDFSICFNKVKVLKDGQLVDDFITKVPAEISTINDLAEGNYIYPLSTVFRKIIPESFPQWFSKCGVGDYPLFMLLAQHGKIKQIDEYMGVYRLNDTGIWYSKGWNYRHREWHKMLVYLASEMDGEIREKLQEKIFYFYSFLENEFEKSLLKLEEMESNYSALKNSYDIKIGKIILKIPRVVKNTLLNKR